MQLTHILGNVKRSNKVALETKLQCHSHPNKFVMKGKNTARWKWYSPSVDHGMWLSSRYSANILCCSPPVYSGVMWWVSKWNHSATHKLNIVVVVDEKVGWEKVELLTYCLWCDVICNWEIKSHSHSFKYDKTCGQTTYQRNSEVLLTSWRHMIKILH
jgi:hypothetical protein